MIFEGKYQTGKYIDGEQPDIAKAYGVINAYIDFTCTVDIYKHVAHGIIDRKCRRKLVNCIKQHVDAVRYARRIADGKGCDYIQYGIKKREEDKSSKHCGLERFGIEYSFERDQQDA